MEQSLVEAMVFSLADSHSDDVRNVWRRRAIIMQRLEEALQANFEGAKGQAYVGTRLETG
jgi:hypothetical protein